MGRRGRRQQRAEKLVAPDSDYTDAHGSVLTLRGSLTVGARRDYAQALAGSPGRVAASRDDTWQRAGELLARFRVASPDERAWVREVLREHCAEWFPDVQAP